MDNNIYHWQIAITAYKNKIYLEFNGTYDYLIHHLSESNILDIFDDDYQIEYIKREEIKND